MIVTAMYLFLEILPEPQHTHDSLPLYAHMTQLISVKHAEPGHGSIPEILHFSAVHI